MDTALAIIFDRDGTAIGFVKWARSPESLDPDNIRSQFSQYRAMGGEASFGKWVVERGYGEYIPHAPENSLALKPDYTNPGAILVKSVYLSEDAGTTQRGG
jgi:hypothetical protein